MFNVSESVLRTEDGGRTASVPLTPPRNQNYYINCSVEKLAAVIVFFLAQRRRAELEKVHVHHVHVHVVPACF